MEDRAPNGGLAEDSVEKLLGNWELLNENLMTLSLDSVRQLIRAEVGGARRDQYIRRLHGRYRKLNLARERAALMKGSLWPVDR